MDRLRQELGKERLVSESLLELFESSDLAVD
jgi:hypothetical protein